MIRIPLDLIQPNPWQTRQYTDQDHIRDLAADIASRAASRPTTLGLLQLPAARLVDVVGRTMDTRHAKEIAVFVELNIHENKCTLQLAYGHNRLEAFRLLAQGDGTETFPGDRTYLDLPLALVLFTNEEMATTAWAENAQRKDLTAIEEAHAIRGMMDSFNWTQDTIAERLNLGRSTVSNKLRLLRLPDQAQDAMRSREITERQAVAILPALVLSPTAQKGAPGWVDKPDDLVEFAKNGTNSDELRRKVNMIFNQTTLNLDRLPFPLDHPFPKDSFNYLHGSLHASRCDRCDIRVRHDGAQRCPHEMCREHKIRLWTDGRLGAAEKSTQGTILRIDPEQDSYTNVDYFNHDTKLAGQILAEGCPRRNLRLKLSDRYGLPLSTDFPDVRVVCLHGGAGGRCKCLSAKKSAATRQRNDEDPEVQQKKENQRLIQKLKDPAEVALAQALADDNTAAWLAVLRSVDYSHKAKDRDAWSLAKIKKGLVQQIIEETISYNRHHPDRARAALTKFLTALGVELPWTPTDPYAEVQRKLDRIIKWIRSGTQFPPPSAAVEGNHDNLNKLNIELDHLPPGDRKDTLAAQIAERREQLTDIAAVVAKWDFKAGGYDQAEWARCGMQLVQGSHNNVDQLYYIKSPNVIQYAAALIACHDDATAKREALAARLRQLEPTA